MKKQIITVLLLFVAVMTKAQSVENYLNTDKIIKFDNQNYELVWSTHPNKNYYKQEYLPKNQKLENFTSMITIDFLKGNYTVQELAKMKVEELKVAKKSNPIVNYNIFQKDNEIVLDFLISANITTKNNQNKLIVERNIYRYITIKTKKTKGVLLLAVSKRAYNKKAYDFIKNIKKNKNNLIVKVGKIKIPKINPKSE